MADLFDEYKNDGKVMEALLVGRNMVNKDPGNYELVSKFLDLIISLAENLPSIEERKGYISQAEVTLSFFEENADLTKELIDNISTYVARINDVKSAIIEFERNQRSNEMALIESENAKQIKKLYGIKQRIIEAKSQEEFDKLLQEISIIDGSIKHDYLTEEQTGHYDQLNRDCSESISQKMRELEYKKNVAYNKKAVESYDEAFKKFKNDEGKYKNQTQLFSLVSTTLFAFDAARLFNETLIYYNHVYSYIFNKLDDDGKLALTRFSIECERKQR